MPLSSPPRTIGECARGSGLVEDAERDEMAEYLKEIHEAEAQVRAAPTQQRPAEEA